jgi:hypothetical protein
MAIPPPQSVPGSGALPHDVHKPARSGVAATPSAAPTHQPTARPTPVARSPAGTPQAVVAGRNKYTWPFASTSIWNMPIGSNAVYVPADLATPTINTLTADQDIIVMDPTATPIPIEQNGAGWSGGNRCAAGGQVLATAPVPDGFTVPSDGANNALAAVLADGQTVIQGQPFARCSPDGAGTVLDLAPTANLYGDGILGAHGGSGLSSLGGTIRLNELVPGGQIRHALKIDLDASADLFPDGANSFRWPAIRQDGCAPGCYGGHVPALTMGALLAIPRSVDIASLGLQTQPALMLAWTLQNYGAYVADNTARSVVSLATEDGPSGSVVDQFQSTWGFPFQAPAGDGTPWSHDINVILSHLDVVANNGPDTVGGGGVPLQPLAPPINN